ncbi:MAG: 2-deoxy-5-keto-D-gluconate 6-phosphate aldolase domain-containing protein [Gemmatimonadaceae bacterium]
MTSGFDQPLYMLPFDQRESFQTKLFGWTGALDAAQTAQIAAAKQVIYDGFRTAIEGGAPRERAAILVDEQFGADILRDAAREGYMTACPTEKSGQKEFDFEYGKEFARHIDAFDPTFCKVLVRYNPEGDRSMNRRQAARLRRLSDYLHRTERKFMFELLVPAEQAELDELNGNKGAYDRLRRPRHMVSAIVELQGAGVEPDVWKVEGFDDHEDCANLVAAARRDGRDRVGCIVLGRGADAKQVERWLRTAASVHGFIGFAVGRTTFWNALLDWRGNHITRSEAVTEIARRYRQWIDIFEHATCATA